MRRIVVRYRTKPGRSEENRKLIEPVFAELHLKSPAGLRYLALQLADDSFVHFVATADDEMRPRLTDYESFRAFQEGIRERCVEPPHGEEAVIIGDYRMLADPDG